jgi:hypothetical protein
MTPETIGAIVERASANAVDRRAYRLGRDLTDAERDALRRRAAEEVFRQLREREWQR